MNNLASEVARAQVVAASDLKTDVWRRGLEPQWETRVPEGLVPADVVPAVLKDYNLARDNAEGRRLFA